MKSNKTKIDHLIQPENFWWATGIEDTFITAPWPQTGRTLDEYELTGHYAKWREDLDLMRSLGVKIARYGVPWHRLNPKRGEWDWSFADQTLTYLWEAGIEPIVDLVHYGLPGWIEKAYEAEDFPELMAEYAGRLAERFKGKLYLYTPLNEPRVTAWYCGKIGWWPPRRKGWRGFLSVMMGVCRGIVRTIEELRRVDPEIVPIHVDATDLYESLEPELSDEVARRQEIVFLALDLISGRINDEHLLFEWLLKNGVKEQQLVWFQEHRVPLDLIGINLYPMFSRKVLSRAGGSLRIKMPYSGAEIIDRLTDLYYERYRCPIFISETASVGSVKKRMAWLESSVEAVRRVRSRGARLVGYTWWPMFALATWAYRQGSHPPEYYLKQMGLWDIDPASGAEMRRVETPLVERYRELAKLGPLAVSAPAQNTPATQIEREVQYV